MNSLGVRWEKKRFSLGCGICHVHYKVGLVKIEKMGLSGKICLPTFKYIQKFLSARRCNFFPLYGCILRILERQYIH